MGNIECEIHFRGLDTYESTIVELGLKKRKVKDAQAIRRLLPVANYNVEKVEFCSENISGSIQNKEKKVKMSNSKMKQNKVDQVENKGHVNKILLTGW